MEESAEMFQLIECGCAHVYVRSAKRGTDWTCPRCGETEDYDNILDVAGPERSLTQEEASFLIGSALVTPAIVR